MKKAQSDFRESVESALNGSIFLYDPEKIDRGTAAWNLHLLLKKFAKCRELTREQILSVQWKSHFGPSNDATGELIARFWLSFYPDKLTCRDLINLFCTSETVKDEFSAHIRMVKYIPKEVFDAINRFDNEFVTKSFINNPVELEFLVDTLFNKFDTKQAENMAIATGKLIWEKAKMSIVYSYKKKTPDTKHLILFVRCFKYHIKFPLKKSLKLYWPIKQLTGIDLFEEYFDTSTYRADPIYCDLRDFIFEDCCVRYKIFSEGGKVNHYFRGKAILGLSLAIEKYSGYLRRTGERNFGARYGKLIKASRYIAKSVYSESVNGLWFLDHEIDYFWRKLYLPTTNPTPSDKMHRRGYISKGCTEVILRILIKQFKQQVACVAFVAQKKLSCGSMFMTWFLKLIAVQLGETYIGGKKGMCARKSDDCYPILRIIYGDEYFDELDFSE